MAEQLLSADPNWGAASGPPPSSMSAAVHNSALPDTADPDEVTLGELMENPRESLQRIGANLKRDASDPRTWLSLAASYFGPKVIGVIAPTVSNAAAGAMRGVKATPRAAVRGVAAMGDIVSPDVIGAVSPRAGKAVEVAQRMRSAMQQPATASPPPVAQPVEPVASAPVVPEPQPVPVARTATAQSTAELTPSAPTNTLPDQKALNMEALARRRAEYQARQTEQPAPTTPAKAKLTAPETKEYMRLILKGKTNQEALDSVLVQRELATSLGLTTPTAAETRFPKGMRGKVPPQ